MIRNTRQREALMRVIRESSRPLTPPEIYELARVHYPKLGLRTVYRHIRDLLDSREIMGIDYPGQPVRYEVVDSRGSRPHLICRECRKVFDLPVDEPSIVYPKLQDFVIEGHEVIYFGRCRACVDRAQRESAGSDSASK